MKCLKCLTICIHILDKGISCTSVCGGCGGLFINTFIPLIDVRPTNHDGMYIVHLYMYTYRYLCFCSVVVRWICSSCILPTVMKILTPSVVVLYL